jgi:transcription-repair coupling factor (superfamily II helicase)
VETLDTILSKYQGSKQVQGLTQLIDNQSDMPLRVPLTGLVGAQVAFVIAATAQNLLRLHLIIATDFDEANYLQNDLQTLLPNRKVHFLPASFKRNVCKNWDYFLDILSENASVRTEIVDNLTQTMRNVQQGSNLPIIITYPEALFEKVVAPTFLNTQRIDIQRNARLDIDFLFEMCLEYGFQRVDFVSAPGQFSVRGGIVDVFSYGNELPYRIELMDVEVESIRIFDPSTQLSKQNVSKISIIPNIHTHFKQEQKVSFFKTLPNHSVIWTHDPQFLLEKWQICFERAEEAMTKIAFQEMVDVKRFFDDRAFVRPFEAMEDLERFSMVLLNHNSLKNNNLQQVSNVQQVDTIHFHAKPQPSFNKNFNVLIQNLHENTASKFTNYLLSNQPQQIKRLFSIFQSLNAKVQVEPIQNAIYQGFIDLDLKIACYTDHQIFDRYHRASMKRGFAKTEHLTRPVLQTLSIGDFVTHIDYGVGKFSGLEKLNINGQIQEAVRLIYQNNDLLYVSVNSLHKIAKFVGKDGTPPKLHRLGSDTWNNLKRATKKKLKDIATDLIKLYAQRRELKGFAFPPDQHLQNELEASFMYEDTPDQFTSTQEVKADMEKPHPMDRLICGDVGFGKTEVAIRAAFKAVLAGKQVAILVPTTILAAQHYKTLTERFADFPVTVDYLSRFKTTKQRKDILTHLKSGKIDIIIGTHALTSKDLVFKDLGLLIVDEEQKFGVAAKEKIRHLKANVDTLTLTATPIPRTLQFSLMAARDLSVMRTPPPNRQPIQTEIHTYNELLIKEAIEEEVSRGGQVFFVHNRVKSLPDIAAAIRAMCPSVDVAAAHGQLEADELEKVITEFVDKRYDVLVCTNIIETGVDISNANTMIINNAHQFGMSDLHQLRGRVGRSNRKAYCYLLCPPVHVLTPDAKKRLETLEEYSELGSGFQIAMRDLDIRGAGNLLGAEQSGFIADIGFETYQKILEEAILELKQGDFKDLFKEELEKTGKNKQFVYDVIIDTDIEMHIPSEYVNQTQERLSLYTQLDLIENEGEIEKFRSELKDRFGKIPIQVDELFDGLRLRWDAKVLGFERIMLKNGQLKCYFVGNPQSPFYETESFKKLMQFILKTGTHKHQMAVRQTPKHLIFIRENVKTLNGARNILKLLRNAI